jgi:hypothetical protein
MFTLLGVSAAAYLVTLGAWVMALMCHCAE